MSACNDNGNVIRCAQGVVVLNAQRCKTVNSRYELNLLQ